MLHHGHKFRRPRSLFLSLATPDELLVTIYLVNGNYYYLLFTKSIATLIRGVLLADIIVDIASIRGMSVPK